MVSVKDIAWAAGFLEGEGSFGSTRNTPIVRADQKQREPLDKLMLLFGGKLFPRQVKYKNGRNPIYSWHIYGPAAAGIMMTLYGFMSTERRQQIRRSIARWMKVKVWARYRNTCLRGHQYTRIYSSTRDRYRLCQTCRTEEQRNRRMRKRNENIHQSRLGL